MIVLRIYDADYHCIMILMVTRGEGNFAMPSTKDPERERVGRF